MLTSVIIVNYQTKELTADCVSSIFRQFTPGSFEVLVVDNNSCDGSVEYLQQRFPNIQVFANTKNVGFGAANNYAAKKAKGDFILLLNSDTIVTNNVLEKYLSFFNNNKDLPISCLGSFMVDQDAAVVHSFGSFPWPLNKMVINKQPPADIMSRVNLKEQYCTAVDIVVGANLFVEKKTYDEYKGFDEQIFLYEEELELQFRMRKNGLVSFMINEQGIIHLEGKSSGSWFKRKCSFISLCYIYKKHLPAWLYYTVRVKSFIYAILFFKNPKTTFAEKINYLKLSVTRNLIY